MQFTSNDHFFSNIEFQARPITRSLDFTNTTWSKPVCGSFCSKLLRSSFAISSDMYTTWFKLVRIISTFRGSRDNKTSYLQYDGIIQDLEFNLEIWATLVRCILIHQEWGVFKFSNYDQLSKNQSLISSKVNSWSPISLSGRNCGSQKITKQGRL